MSNTSLSIAFNGAEDESLDMPDKWARIIQDAIPEYQQYTNFNQISAMLAHAMSGGSARSYLDQGCPASIADGVVTIPLTVIVFPSQLDLEYTVSTATGSVGQGEYTEVSRSFDLVVPMQKEIELPGIIEGISTTWQTSCYNSFGQVVSEPTIEVDKAVLKLSEEVFGVLRIEGTMLGYEHSITMELVKSETDLENEDQRIGYRIENLTNNAQVAWVDENGDTQSESIDLEIPECVKSMLEVCATGELLGNVNVTHADDGRHVTVYYSTCTGEPIGTYSEK